MANGCQVVTKKWLTGKSFNVKDSYDFLNSDTFKEGSSFGLPQI